jgi:hypothetical protein
MPRPLSLSEMPLSNCSDNEISSPFATHGKARVHCFHRAHHQDFKHEWLQRAYVCTVDPSISQTGRGHEKGYKSCSLPTNACPLYLSRDWTRRLWCCCPLCGRIAQHVARKRSRLRSQLSRTPVFGQRGAAANVRRWQDQDITPIQGAMS